MSEKRPRAHFFDPEPSKDERRADLESRLARMRRAITLADTDDERGKAQAQAKRLQNLLTALDADAE